MSRPYKFVLVEPPQDGVVVVRYNKPETGNSLHPQLLADMVDALRWANTHPTIQIIIITGQGKFFCTGMELLDQAGMSFAIGSDFHQLNRLLITSPKILVAAVNGPAAGFGVSSLALFDLVYSVPEAYFFTPFVKWGLTAEACSSVTFPRLMGHQNAARLCLAGARVDANELHRLGLISEVLMPDGRNPDFVARVVDIAKDIVRRSPPGALATTKRLLRHDVLQDLLDANDRECDAFHNERFPSGEPERAMRQFRLDQERKRMEKSKL